jgi:hypothetical protein
MSPPHGAAPAIEQGCATCRAVVEPGERRLALEGAGRQAPAVEGLALPVEHRGDASGVPHGRRRGAVIRVEAGDDSPPRRAVQ